MLKAQAVLEVADRGFDLGVAAVVGLQLQGGAVAVGDEPVVVEDHVQRQLRARGWAHPAHDQPHRRSALAERAVAGLGHIRPALQPVADRHPGVVGICWIALRTPLLHLAVIE
jgi:hypothetical protein